MDVLAVGQWRTNAELMRDVARLGYLDGEVLDLTFGEGNFWGAHTPDLLVSNDRHEDADLGCDFTRLPMPDDWCDTVVFDPPYRMSGRRDRGEFDQRFGLAEYRSNTDILGDLEAGAVEGLRVCRRYLLVKCQDQVNGGRVRWQTDIVTRAVESRGGFKVDRFEFVTRPRPQPEGRRQLTSRRNHSTLLVFAKQRGLVTRKNPPGAA
jgi:hypothetical protein